MKINEKNQQVKEETDAIWEMCLNVGPDSQILQLRDQLLRQDTLAAASDRLVLQEASQDVRLLVLRQPDKSKPVIALPTETLVSKGTPVLIIKEHFAWYLIAVMREPWQMGWVEKNDIRVKTDFILRVNDEHYLETIDGRHFPRIAPYTRGYDKNLMKELAPATLPPKYNIKYIIMHCTTGARMESTINHFKDPASGVSTHLLIGRDGRVVQFVPFNRIAYHAGYSWWEMEKHLNNFSIGIELDNAGSLRPGGKDKDGRDVWVSRKATFTDDKVQKKAHWKRPKYDQVAWETYPKAQIDVAWNIVKALKEKYGIALKEGDDGIREILGHDLVNLLNREDPGPLFTPTMQDWRQKLFGRSEPAFKTFYLTKATDLLRNSGLSLPNESTSLHEPSILPTGSEVILLGTYNPTGVWTKISVKQSSKAQALRNRTGWVKTNSLEPFVGKGQTGGRQMGNDNKGGKVGNRNPPPRPIIIRQFTIKNDQPFYMIAGGEPTPRVPLEAGTKVRRQELNGKWMQVVVLSPIGDEVGVQGWVKWDPPENPELWSTTMPKPETVPADVRSSGVPLWQHKDDEQLSKLAPQLRKTVPGRLPQPVPAVFPLEKSAAVRVDLTKEWQFFIRAINYKMPVEKVSALFGYRLAFTNFTGFGDPAHPRADFLKGENLSSPLPQLDKVRTCALSVMTGVVEGDHLIIQMMNGSQPPPLKPGYVLPERIENLTPDIYEFTPKTHRHLFFAANRTARGGKVISPIYQAYGPDYPPPTKPGEMRGAVYEWTGDGKAYAWMPHVAPGNFKVRYPLVYLTRLPPGAPIPSPYKDLDGGVA